MATPFTDFVHLTEASSGATRNSGTNGDLNTLLNWALPQAGWTRTYHNAGTFESVFEIPGGGKGLYVCHNSAITGNAGFAEVRMFESATGYAFADLVDPVPTLAQVAHNASVWWVSSVESTADRAFLINVWETGIEYISNINSVADNYGGGLMCLPFSRLPADVWAWCIGQRGSTSTAVGADLLATNVGSALGTSLTGKMFFMRNYAGSIKSTYASISARGTSLGIVPGAPVIFAGVGGVAEKEKILVHDHGASTNVIAANAVPIRACIPNFWSPVHSALTGATFTDVFTDTDYDPAADFKLTRAATNNGIFLETTNTSTGFPGA